MSGAGNRFQNGNVLKATAEESSVVCKKQGADYVPEFDRETVKYLKGMM